MNICPWTNNGQIANQQINGNDVLTQDAKLNFAVPDFKILRTVLEVSETDCKTLRILKDNIGILLFQNHVFHVR